MRGLIGLGLLLLASPLAAQDHAVAARFGLLGIGVEYGYRLSDRLAFRIGLNGSGFSFDETESDIEYEFDLDFDSTSLGVDVHPLKGAFRVSAGLLKNDNGLSAEGLPTGTLSIGGTDYVGSDVGILRGSVAFDSTAWFAGVGWDWLRNKRVGLALDLGVVDQGAPSVRLSADGPIVGDPAFADDLAAEQAELQDSLDDLDIYPFAMFGLVFRF